MNAEMCMKNLIHLKRKIIKKESAICLVDRSNQGKGHSAAPPSNSH